jgi:hypothetical protein
MAYLPTEPLTKVTLNLYLEDVEWLRRNQGTGWTTWVREAVRSRIREREDVNRD